jgi:hypothetical protein
MLVYDWKGMRVQGKEVNGAVSTELHITIDMRSTERGSKLVRNAGN